MNKRSVNSQVYKALLSRSGNKCAFPGCTHPIFNNKFEFVAQLCHIEAVSPDGQRFNKDLTTEQVNSYGNLLFMCYKHHVETNDVTTFSVNVLKKIKQDHESQYVTSPFNVDMSHIFALKRNVENFWKRVEEINTNEHSIPDLRIKINVELDHNELIKQVSASLDSLETLLGQVGKDDKNKYWEIFNLGVPNHTSAIRVLLEHMNIKYHEEKLNNNPSDMEVREQLDKLRVNFLNLAKNSAHFD